MSRDLSLNATPQPGLRVTLCVKPMDHVMCDDVTCDDAMAVRVDVTEAARPLRISVYLDGDLVDTWVPATTGYDLVVPGLSGRHVITARAIDAEGRWGGASALVDSGSA